MKKHHGTVYWSLCLLAVTALFARPQLSAAQEPIDERVASLVKTEILAKGGGREPWAR